MKNDNYYYNVAEDINKYPDAWCFLIVGGRNTGKTYSALKHCMDNNIKFAFVKRTMDDVSLICTGSRNSDIEFDLSPFKPINRDCGTDIRPIEFKKGIGGFYKFVDNKPVGAPIGYLISLSGVTKFKGFDLSECEWIIYDEFIPKKGERINAAEGDQLMDLYKTVLRDREHRHLPMLKLVCLANAVNIANPTTNILEVVDNFAYMNANNVEELYIGDRGIFLRMLEPDPDFMEVERNSILYKAMGDTQWGAMAFENSFSYDDFSNVGKENLKGYKPYIHVKYKKQNWYIWLNPEEGKFTVRKSKFNDKIKVESYNLNKENDQKKYYRDEYYRLRFECMDGNMKFETYTMYDVLISNFKKYFKVV